MERSETDEEEQAEMLMRAMTEKNVTKIEQALAKTKKHGKGFVLSSHFYKPKPLQSSSKLREKQIYRLRKSGPKIIKAPTKAIPDPDETLPKGITLDRKQWTALNRARTAVGKDKQQLSGQDRLPIVIGSPIGSPAPTRKPSSKSRSSPPRTKSAATRRKKPQVTEESPRPHSAYITEYLPPPIKVDMAIQSDGPEQNLPQTPTESPAPPPATPDNTREIEGSSRIPIEVPEPMNANVEPIAREEEKENIVPPQVETPPMEREEPLGDECTPTNEHRISLDKFTKLGIVRRPMQFRYNVQLPLTNKEKDPINPAPDHPNIYMTRVPKEGGNINTPFYMQVQMPEGALRGDVIMKFETQSYKNSKLVLDETDKLCSDVIDITMKPLAYCLHKTATVRVRILEECVNKFDDITIIDARHFTWSRKPTEIETTEVNGKTHYYAVTQTQQLGKFAVITSRKIDRFVMTSAGGIFTSKTLPDVTVQLDEGLLRADFAHLVEVSVENTREEAINEANKLMSVKGVSGQLVACSPIIDITKEIMGRTGQLEEGIMFPDDARLTIPLTTHTQTNDSIKTWKKPTLKVMQKLGNQTPTEDPQEDWEDISEKNNTLFHPVQAQKGESVPLDARLPCQVMVLIFDQVASTGPKPPECGISDLCHKIRANNNLFEVAIMIHQRNDQRQILNIHVIPEKAKDMVSGAMKESGEWELLGEISTRVYVEERETLFINFRGDIKLTVNQLDPEIVFHSRRWQGYQYQVEATDEGYANTNIDVIGGFIELLQKRIDIIRIVHNSTVVIPYRQAKPYRPTVFLRPLPKVAVFREYKLKWLKSLSAAEQEKYKSINSP